MEPGKMRLLLPIVAFGAALFLTACDQRDTTASSEAAPTTGQRVDAAINKAGEKIDEVTEKTGRNLEELGQRLQTEAEQTKESAANERAGEPASATEPTETNR